MGAVEGVGVGGYTNDEFESYLEWEVTTQSLNSTHICLRTKYNEHLEGHCLGFVHNFAHV